MNRIQHFFPHHFHNVKQSWVGLNRACWRNPSLSQGTHGFPSVSTPRIVLGWKNDARKKADTSCPYALWSWSELGTIYTRTEKDPQCMYDCVMSDRLGIQTQLVCSMMSKEMLLLVWWSLRLHKTSGYHIYLDSRLQEKNRYLVL